MNKLNFVAVDLVKLIFKIIFSIHFVAYTSSAIAEVVLVDLTGSTPEEASITVSVNKPGNATNGLITLNVYDADFSNEGELIINGNPAIKLFGPVGTNANDAKSANITFSTPAAYWRDGNNTLLFRHTRTVGYIINEVVVTFEVDGTVSSVTDSAVRSGSLPVDLTGLAPEEVSISIKVKKPANATFGIIFLNVYDADIKNEGELIINGNPAIALFGAAGVSKNDNKTVRVTLSSRAAYWKDGVNTLVFRHTRTAGFYLDQVDVQFMVDNSANSETSSNTVVNTGALPVDLTGVAPEEASIKMTINKPVGATKGLITLNVFDADVSNEGELIINGNPAIALFGAAGVGSNDNKTASIKLSSPAAYWQDGDNTLLFRHTRTGGFYIDEVVVQFEVTIESEPAPVILTGADSGSTTGSQPTTGSTVSAGSLPIDMTGALPEEKSLTVNVSKPGSAINATITLDVYDADFSDEGELIINGNPAIKLFGPAGTNANDGKSANITFSTPASYWRDGNNTLLFRHTRTVGYVIDDVVVQFDVGETISVAPQPQPQPSTASTVSAGSLPIDMTGASPEEKSLTVNVSKPGNAVNATITLDVYDADFSDEGELIINGNPAIKLFGPAGTNANDAKSASITFSTPASYWRDGNNTLLFRHTRTVGYVINDVIVQFDAGTTSSVQSGPGSVSLNWTAPFERADNTALSLSEISGYTIYYGNSASNFTQSLSVNDGFATSATINSLPLGIYYMVVTTRDYAGRESKYSDVISVEAR